MSLKVVPESDNPLLIEPSWPDHYSSIDRDKTMRIRKYIARKNGKVTQTAIARMAGMNKSTCNLIINGIYTTSPSRFLCLIEDAINAEMARNVGHRQVPFVETTVWEAVNKVCEWARNNVDEEGVGIVCGHVGVGKTRALKEYGKQHPNTIYIRAFNKMNESVLLNLLLHETGAMVFKQSQLRFSAGTNADKKFSLIRHLEGTESLIILDETTRAARQCVGALRDIAHGANIALVLCGRESLKARFSDPNALRDDDGEVCSRSQGVEHIPVIEGIKKSDCQMICEAYWKQAHELLKEDAVEMYWQCCSGSARTLARLLSLSWNAWVRHKYPPTPDLISHIWRGSEKDAAARARAGGLR